MASAPFDVLTTTAKELETLLDSGKVTSAQLVEVYLAEIEKKNGYLKAVISTAPRNSLIERANVLDIERSSGTVRSHLHGLPILVKDNIDTHPNLGMDTTSGSFALAGARPRKSADVVERLPKGGNTHAHFDSSKLPDRLLGLIFRLGHRRQCWSVTIGAWYRDGGIPYYAGQSCRLYTLKPTIGIVSQQGIVPVSHICDAAGPMTKSVLDLAHLMDIIVDPAKTSVPPDGFASVMTDTWADLRVGVLDPAEWNYPDFVTKPFESTTKQMASIRHPTILIDEYEDAYKKIESMAKSFEKYVPLPNGDDLEFHGTDSLSTLWSGYFKEDFEKYTVGLENAQVYTLEELVEFNRKHSEKELPPRQYFKTGRLGVFALIEQGYPKQDKLEQALASKLSAETLDATLRHAREVSRTNGIDKILRDYNLDVIIGPAESSMTDLASASVSWEHPHPASSVLTE
ncbi:MAG: hypothetical protein Q9213_005561 [Squamulea squamosa]